MRHIEDPRVEIQTANKPQKQLLWLWMQEVFAESARYEVGLDLASGEMLMRPWFRTTEYIGVDVDAERLQMGIDFFNERGIVSTIEDLDENIKGDFVICLQTIGFNQLFDVENIMPTIRKCVEATRENGLLALNVGFRAADHFPAIEDFLERHFKSVEVRRYGAMRIPVARRLSYLLAKCMYHAPFLARVTRNPNRLYVCRSKLPTAGHPASRNNGD